PLVNGWTHTNLWWAIAMRISCMWGSAGVFAKSSRSDMSEWTVDARGGMCAEPLISTSRVLYSPGEASPSRTRSCVARRWSSRTRACVRGIPAEPCGRGTLRRPRAGGSPGPRRRAGAAAEPRADGHPRSRRRSWCGCPRCEPTRCSTSACTDPRVPRARGGARWCEGGRRAGVRARPPWMPAASRRGSWGHEALAHRSWENCTPSGPYLRPSMHKCRPGASAGLAMGWMICHKEGRDLRAGPRSAHHGDAVRGYLARSGGADAVEHVRAADRLEHLAGGRSGFVAEVQHQGERSRCVLGGTGTVGTAPVGLRARGAHDLRPRVLQRRLVHAHRGGGQPCLPAAQGEQATVHLEDPLGRFGLEQGEVVGAARGAVRRGGCGDHLVRAAGEPGADGIVAAGPLLLDAGRAELVPGVARGDAGQQREQRVCGGEIPAVGQLGGDARGVVVAHEGQRVRPAGRVEEALVAAQRVGELEEVVVAEGGPDRLPQLV